MIPRLTVVGAAAAAVALLGVGLLLGSPGKPNQRSAGCDTSAPINQEDRTWKDLRASCSLQGRILYNAEGEPMCGTVVEQPK